MFNKLKQFKDLRDKAKQLQTALSSESVEGSGGWGKVKVTMDGNQAVTGIAIDDALLTPSEKGKLETGLKEAFADALKKAQRKAMEKMKDIGGIDLPGLN
jgi:DNA-binding YbaB/EbfC family protein